MRELLAMFVPVLVAALTALAVQYLKKASAFLDQAPAFLKQLAAVGIAFGLTKLGALLGLALPPSLAQLAAMPEAISALLSAALAMLIHAGWKADQAPV